MSTPDLVSTQKILWWRSVPFNAVVVGVASFLAPGMYSAMAATGAGGLASITVGNASTACAYALIIPSALAGSAFMGKFGHKWALIIGACGYAPFSAAYYCNSSFGTQWFLIFSAIICGLTSGIFWATEGVTVLLYSEPYRKARMVAIWQSIYCAAPIVGGAVNLALNIDLDKKGGLRPKTYAVFVALNCIAPLAAAFLTPAHKVQRTDGQKVKQDEYAGFWKEIWLTIMEMKHPRVIACSLLWSQSLFSPSYYGTFLASYFSVRTRALGSLVNPVMTIILYQLIGVVLDNKRWQARYRIVSVYVFIQAVSLMSFIWLIVLSKRFEANPPETALDWSNNMGYAWAPYLLGLAVQHVQYGLFYYFAAWLFTPKEGKGRLTRIIGTLRSAESGSAAIAYGLNASRTVSLSQIGFINLAFSVVSIIAGSYIISYIWGLDKSGNFEMSPNEYDSSDEKSVDMDMDPVKKADGGASGAVVTSS